MSCIFNHCHGQVVVDFAIIDFYGIAVFVMTALAFLARSRSIQTAALIVASVWFISILSYLYIGGPQYYAMTLLLDAALAYQFWRMARREIFPAVLCVITLVEIVFLVVAAAVSLKEFWIIFVLNRIFEAMLAYIIGCSIYRIRKLKTRQDESRDNVDQGLRLIAG